MIPRSTPSSYALFARYVLQSLGVGAAAALALTGSACGGTVVVDNDGSEAGGVGGSGSTSVNVSSSASSTGTGPLACAPPLGPDDHLAYQCFDLTPNGCPSNGDGSVFMALSSLLNGSVSCPNEPCGCYDEVTGVPCGPDPSITNQCCYYAKVTSYSGVCEGRPFTIEGVARTAPLASRADWIASLAPCLTDLDDRTRRELADAWAADARYEHASVASFARFTLELLSVGAPAELVRDAQRAIGDEIRHAEICFGLASAFAGAPIGPSALPMDGALAGRSDPAAIAAHVVREGCVGETLAALSALAARDAATDPAVRAALDEIASDEAAHAALAWRYVAWACQSGGPAVRAAVRRAFAEANPDAGSEGSDLDPAVLRAYGRLPDADRREVVRRGLAEVVGPCASALELVDPTPAPDRQSASA